MKQKTKGLVIGMLFGTLITSGLSYAKSIKQNIEVYYDNIKIYKDNVLCELKDANGSTIEPFIYEGTTYLPVRGTASLSDMQVTWDGNTKSVYLWDKILPGEINLMDVCPPYDGKDMWIGNIRMAGNNYDGIFLIPTSADSYSLINLNGQYSYMNMVIAPIDNESFDADSATINFYLDGIKTKSVEIKKGDYLKEISLPLNHALQLKIEKKYFDGCTSIGIGNMTLK